MPQRHLNIKITGKVQGVGYRATAKATANQAGVNGFVKNEPDGSIYIEAEADEWSLQLFLDFCNEGPQGSVVTSVDTHEGEMKNYRNFEIVKRKL